MARRERRAMVSFHGTNTFLTPPPMLSLSRFLCRLRVRSWPGTVATVDYLPFFPRELPSVCPSTREPLLFYCIQSGWFDGLLTNLIFFSSLWAGFYVFRLFAAIFYARTAFSGFTIWRNGWLYGCAVGSTLFFADLIFFFACWTFFVLFTFGSIRIYNVGRYLLV